MKASMCSPPLFGVILAGLLLLALKFVIRNPALYAAPKGNQPPPWWIRGTLILTCTLVSFFHGSNDGQKGMNLIMMTLIGTVPTAYALNRSLPASQVERLQITSMAASEVIDVKAAGYNVLGNPRPAVIAYVVQHEINDLSVLGGSGARDRRPGKSIRINQQDSGGPCRQHPQRYVSSIRSNPAPHEG
jgi:phosphate/sulfate permease